MNAVSWLERLPRYSEVRYNLYRTYRLLTHFGLAPRQQDVYVIAGSKGKGTVANTLAAILEQAGIAAGLYTSPHLERLEERIAAGGQEISPAELEELASYVAGNLPSGRREVGRWTQGEVLLLVALLHFRRRGARVLVLEAGLGGRLDPVNVFPRPRATCITSVSLEHSEILGPTVEQIAWEKAGILKKGVPAFTGALGQGYREIAARARQVGCPLYGPDDVDWHKLGSRWQLCLPGERLMLPPHGATPANRRNRALAAALARCHPDVGKVAVAAGIRCADLPGRFELVPGKVPLVLDVAHTPEAVADLIQGLAEQFPGARLGFVAGFAADKNGPAMVALMQKEGQVVVVPAGFDVSRLAAPAVESVEGALAALAGRADVVCVTGSFAVVAQARRLSRG